MTMKTAQLIATALILGVSVSALAQQEGKEIMRGKTRAEVVAELKQAESEGKAMPSSFAAFDAPAKAGIATGKSAIAHK
jgi:hypothetical protein